MACVLTAASSATVRSVDVFCDRSSEVAVATTDDRTTVGPSADRPTGGRVSRRVVAAGLAWSVPAVVVASRRPRHGRVRSGSAASRSLAPCVNPARSLSRTPGGLRVPGPYLQPGRIEVGLPLLRDHLLAAARRPHLRHGGAALRDAESRPTARTCSSTPATATLPRDVHRDDLSHVGPHPADRVGSRPRARRADGARVRNAGRLHLSASVGQLSSKRSGAVSRCRNAVSRASRTVSRRRRSARIAASTYSGWFPGGGGGET